ncbi:transposable element Tcb1 transposase [Trichonephila clavipes]|nr:transposable element Tcb1 transposase [Trichonephila clavipes]
MKRLSGAIFQQDNARPHTARVSQDCLRTVTTFLGQPDPQICLQSSISGIIWDGELDIPTSLNELEARLQQIWNEMFQDIIQNLYASMPYRAFALEGVQHGIKSCVPLTFSMN